MNDDDDWRKTITFNFIHFDLRKRVENCWNQNNNSNKLGVALIQWERYSGHDGRKVWNSWMERERERERTKEKEKGGGEWKRILSMSEYKNYIRQRHKCHSRSCAILLSSFSLRISSCVKLQQSNMLEREWWFHYWDPRAFDSGHRKESGEMELNWTWQSSLHLICNPDLGIAANLEKKKLENKYCFQSVSICNHFAKRDPAKNSRYGSCRICM